MAHVPQKTAPARPRWRAPIAAWGPAPGRLGPLATLRWNRRHSGDRIVNGLAPAAELLCHVRRYHGAALGEGASPAAPPFHRYCGPVIAQLNCELVTRFELCLVVGKRGPLAMTEKISPSTLTLGIVAILWRSPWAEWQGNAASSRLRVQAAALPEDRERRSIEKRVAQCRGDKSRRDNCNRSRHNQGAGTNRAARRFRPTRVRRACEMRSRARDRKIAGCTHA